MSETTVPRGRLSRSARRAQLLDAARDVFAAQGYHAAAMDDIAERAGVSKPVLYQHFPGKLELYQALLTTYADELVAQVEAALAATAENEERVQAAVAAYFDFVAGDGKAYRLIFGSDLRGDAAEVVEDAMNRCIEKVADGRHHRRGAGFGAGAAAGRRAGRAVAGGGAVLAGFRADRRRVTRPWRYWPAWRGAAWRASRWSALVPHRARGWPGGRPRPPCAPPAACARRRGTP